jgi:septal ring factor EnvC (AmiA/AmiB activator)
MTTGWRALAAATLLLATPATAGEDAVAAHVAAVSAREAALPALRADVIGAAEEERALRLALAAQRAEITSLLAALQAVGRAPDTGAALHPDGPLAAARARAMLAPLRPALAEEASALADELAAIDAVRQRYRDSMAALDAGLASLATAHDALRAALDAEPPLPGPDAATAALIRESDTLTALAAALAEGDAVPPDPGPRDLIWPVAGQVVIGFGGRDAGGERRPGIVIAAPPQALVTAPTDAVVRYAGPFLDYGYVAVLAPEPGTLVVLAGLAELHVRAGDTLRHGDLVGLLGGRTPAAEDYLMLTETGTGAGAEETLYVEIRHGTGPVDPEPWFTGGNG